MKFLTVIKGASERLPNKNFLKIGGKPLWRYCLDNLGAAEVHINTDVPDVLSDNLEGLSTVVQIIPRDQKHVDWEAQSAVRGSPVNSILESFFHEVVEDDAEPVVLFHVTSPFVRMKSVLEAATRLANYASVSSVQRVQDFAWLGEKSRRRPLNFDESRVSRTQDLPPIFLSRGAFFIVSKKSFMTTRTRNPEPHGFYEVDPLEAIEIDTLEDYKLANIVAEGLLHS